MTPPRFLRGPEPQVYTTTTNVYINNYDSGFYGYNRPSYFGGFSIIGAILGDIAGQRVFGPRQQYSFGMSPLYSGYQSYGFGVGDTFQRTTTLPTGYTPPGRLIYDNGLGGQIYSSGFGLFGAGNQTSLTQPAAQTSNTQNSSSTQNPTASQNPTSSQNTSNNGQGEIPVNSGDGTPSSAYLNQLINSDKAGKITNKEGNTIDIINESGVDNVKAGKAEKMDHQVIDDQTLNEENGYIQTFSIIDKSGNIYTLTAPEYKNGKLTYKLDIANSDLRADDDKTTNYEPNKDYKEDTRLEVKIVSGEIVLYNESGQPIARKI